MARKPIEEPFFYRGLAMDYYVTGRFAFRQGFNIAPNLLHHAVELMLKSEVYREFRDVSELPAKDKYRHDLVSLMDRLQGDAGEPVRARPLRRAHRRAAAVGSN